ncbi:hypothetical protein F7725_008103 [Dissostichus mawsoni]|uniref:Uncharacterized protein n=1 Tax=Dissostichus mawsoni TaxID=36200 RepID=A0A7J5Y6A5_DISMA|nr:hypothetical protein F7725_008103 [Dissostichus mawsoni]
MSSRRRRGMVIVVATSSGRRLSWRRLPEMRSSVRLACSLRARSSGLREGGARLRPHTDTEELPSCTSHSRDGQQQVLRAEQGAFLLQREARQEATLLVVTLSGLLTQPGHGARVRLTGECETRIWRDVL